MKSPVTLLSRLLDDVERLEPSVKGIDRDLITINSRFENEGYGFLSVALPALCDSLDRGIVDGRFTCPSHFSKMSQGALPRFLSGLLCKIFDTKTGHLLKDPDVGVLKCLRQVLRFFKKVKLSADRSKKLERKAEAKFVETDTSISRFLPSSRRTQFLRAVCKVLLPNLDNFAVEDLPYKHGPGGVSEKLKTNRKWVHLRDELRKDASLAYLLGFDPSILSDRGGYDLSTSYSGLPLFETRTFHENSSRWQASSGIATLFVVPKDSTSMRTITAEPTVKQYYQQGLNTHLREKILECNVLSLSLALSDQDENQKLALEGSKNDKYSTLDLSSASDLMSKELVMNVFHNRPMFLQHALNSRSAFVSTKTFGVVELQKFAGMGNALTFPIQSVVFASIAIAAILDSDGIEPSYRNAKRAARSVRVYGDDIIVETHRSHVVIDWLTSFGLIINQKKSFLKGDFKESCGMDAFRGYCVTPVYLRYEPVITERDPSKIASLVSTSNQLFMLALYSAAEYVRSIVEGFIRLPMVSARSSSLGWHSRVDTSIAQKWDEKLQRLVFRGQVITPCYAKDDISNESAALMKSLSTLRNVERALSSPSYVYDNYLGVIHTVDDENLERSVARFKTRIRRRWVPAEAGILRDK